MSILTEQPEIEICVVGFDSAWTDRPKKPGAICAVTLTGGNIIAHHPPRLVSFVEALEFINEIAAKSSVLLVALDQPTVVPNQTGSRPVERVAASVISWMGGGVQPANRGKVGMFDDEAPIWRFIQGLGALQLPEKARTATQGRYIIEVFPALALAALDSEFFQRLGAPRYNPERPTFKSNDWGRVISAVHREAKRLGFDEIANWVEGFNLNSVKKADQDQLDSIICLLIGLRWRLEPRNASAMLGTVEKGYIVTPTTIPLQSRLAAKAQLRNVPLV